MTTNNQKAFEYLTQVGLSGEAVIGVVGNWLVESGPGGQINPGAVQSGGPGRGIEQWSVGDRWDKLIAWARSQGRDPNALDTQMQYAVKEMTDDGTMAQLKTVGKGNQGILDAAAIFMRREERPADQSDDAARKRAEAGIKASGLSDSGLAGLASTVQGAVDSTTSTITNAVQGAVSSAIGSSLAAFWASAKPFVAEAGAVVAGVVLIGAGLTRLSRAPSS